MVSGLVLEHETLVADNASELGGLLDGPRADVGPLLVLLLALGLVGGLLGVRGLPSGLPVVGELLVEGGLDDGGLC